MPKNDWDSAYRIEEIQSMRSDDTRNQLVVKSNALVQRARFEFNLIEQRIVMFLVSKISRGDIGIESYYFSFQEFCDVCSIDSDAGSAYEYIRDAFKRLASKSIWIDAEWDRDGQHYVGERLLTWFHRIELSVHASAIWVRFHEDMIPYLFQLREHFTQYQLRNILAMKSTYATALYELLKSYEYLDRPIDFDLEELKFMLGADNVKSYAIYNNFKQKVLDIAVREINTYTDLTIAYKTVKQGRKVSRIIFAYHRKVMDNEFSDMLENQARRFHPRQLPGQFSLDGFS